MEPRYWVAHICAAKSYEQQGQYTEALAACAKAWEFSGGNTEALSLAGHVHAVRGERAEAEGKIQQMLQLKTKRFVPPYNLALVFAGLQETEAALSWLELAFADRDVHMTFLLDHKWKVLGRNERMQQIVARVGFSRFRKDSSSQRQC
jgi:tetratricopeptide (TPR) repeat protein